MKKVKEYLFCVVGALFVAIGVYFFKFPNQFSIGGVSGISIILSDYFHISKAGNIMFVINIVLLIAGFLFCGKSCGIKTVIGTLTLSGALILFENVIPITKPLTNQPLLELVYAVMFPAIGSSILFNSNGSTGGTDIIAQILRKYTNINIGMALLITDILITLGTFLFGVEKALYAILGLLLKSLVIDSVIENINLCKCFQIITDDPDDICRYITTVINRSATVVEAKGFYTNSKKYVIITVLNRFQAVALRKYIKKNHTETFIILTNSSEIIGKGFRGFDLI